ncbi:hypothetical protein B9Z19DRAFT_998805 [Tuber borchii]|uniref:Uncharacterized protein n=1 Tax=Tuber borchii TaxID=42251 RepID=A0A2T6ZGT5_TUBBO|nr:hypothetical protein B9Z19DRAFT_998805 [Tuber borchii]
MSINRSVYRNVTFHDATNPDVTLGGLLQNGPITEGNFLDILEIVLAVSVAIRVLRRASTHLVSRVKVPLEIGKYELLILSAPIKLNKNVWVEHAITQNVTGRNKQFRRKVRDHDRMCVISGIRNPEGHIQANNWCSSEACHVFPLEHESPWDALEYGEFVTDIKDTSRRRKISSCQNGLTLESGIHVKFDPYKISVNPDDNYKIGVFDIDIYQLDGRILELVWGNLENPHHVPDQLLKWLFEQSVLSNVKRP